MYVDRSLLARKDPAVGELVDRLASDLSTNFDLVDHWEDLMAVGLALPSDHGVLIYVAVITDDEGELLHSPDRYFYECESPSRTDALGYHVAYSGDHVSYDQVAKAATRHLRT
jgi:hypothetical protein